MEPVAAVDRVGDAQDITPPPGRRACRMLPDKRAGGLPKFLEERGWTVGDTCPAKALSSQCALGVPIGDTLHQKM
jgi:hypothetical protein